MQRGAKLPPSRLRAWVFVLCGGVAIFGSQASARAEVVVVKKEVKEVAQRGRRIATRGDVSGSIVLQEDRELRRKLDGVRKTLTDGNPADGARYLGALLQDPATRDFFIAPSDSDRARRSFKAELRQLIAALPAAGQQAYELQFGSAARKMLEAAIANGDAQTLQDVATRYYHTEAAGAALYLLGKIHLDRGRPREAVSCLAQLQQSPSLAAAYEPQLSLLIASCWVRAGEPDQAAQTLARLKQHNPEASFVTASQRSPVSLFQEPSQSLEWLGKVLPSSPVSRLGQHDWRLHLGNASRQAAVPGSTPFRVSRWTLPITNSAEALAAMENERTGLRSQKATPLPMITPLAVGNVLLLPAANGVQAIDIASGKPLWPVNRTNEFEIPGIERQMWRNAAFGSLTSDGQSVFMVADNEDLPDHTSNGANTQVIFWRGPAAGDGGDSTQSLNNRLIATEISGQGKLRWSAGGEDDARPEFKDLSFLGNPLPYGGQLFVLGECRGAIRLYCLDAQTGHVEWWQELAVVETSIAHDYFRRMVGACPSISDGVVVCPTSAGGVVAVDLSSRSLLWAYQYPRVPRSLNDPNRGQSPNLRQGDRWADGTAVIAAGHVLLTPPESDELHCLDLFTGEPKWVQKRGQSVFLAGVHGDVLLLVEPQQITGWKLADGSSLFKTPLPAAPSGRGVMTKAGAYHLPLINAQVVQIELPRGTIASKIQPLRGIPAGNLIWHKGMFISTGSQYLEAFDDLEHLQQQVAAKAASAPRDPSVLFDQGRLALADSHLEQAVELFRSAYQIQPTSVHRSALTSALQDALKLNNPQRDAWQAELDKLLGF